MSNAGKSVWRGQKRLARARGACAVMDKQHTVFIQSAYINVCLQRGTYIDAGKHQHSGQNKHYVFFKGLRVEISMSAGDKKDVHGAIWCPTGKNNVKRAEEEYCRMIKKMKSIREASRKRQTKKYEKKQHLLMGK